MIKHEEHVASRPICGDLPHLSVLIRPTESWSIWVSYGPSTLRQAFWATIDSNRSERFLYSSSNVAMTAIPGSGRGVTASTATFTTLVSSTEPDAFIQTPAEQ